MPQVLVFGRNTKTGQTRQSTTTHKALEKAIWEGIDRCSGPCACAVEPDGECPKGWPSRLTATGLI